MDTILYIHGFKSSGNARKAQVLRKKFQNVVSPDIPVEPTIAIEFLSTVISENNIDLIIGSSLGGFYAYILHKKLNKKTILINPSLTPWESLKDQVGIHKRFVGADSFFWRKDYNRQLQKFEEETEEFEINENLLSFFIANDDTLLDHSNIKMKFKNSDIFFFDNAGHEFTGFLRTIPIIKNILNR